MYENGTVCQVRSDPVVHNNNASSVCVCVSANFHQREGRLPSQKCILLDLARDRNEGAIGFMPPL